jgi:hypothetical protein
MQKLALLLFFTLLFSLSTSAQYTQLRENRGEVGVFQGMSSYRGDIAPGVYTFNPSYGIFYKKLVNDYIGIRFNYEKIVLEGNDNLSTNMYVFYRALSFNKASHEASVLLELYFLKLIDGNNHYRFSPYLSFGVGALKSISGKLTDNYTNADVTLNLKSIPTITYPINLGLKYNVIGPFNVFAEATYRFSNSDQIDFFTDANNFPRSRQSFQPSTSGNDQYFSFKAGLSYNLLKIYGPDKKLNEKKKSVFSGEEKVSKTSTKKGLFSLFKR